MTVQVPVTPATEAAAIFDPASLVDELGILKAQIAKLEAREAEITTALKAGGRDKYAGALFDCTVSLSERCNWDMKKLREDLGEELMAPYVKPATQITTLKVTAKK